MSVPGASLTAMAFVCTVQRADGVGLATTSADCAQAIDGIVHEPAPGLEPSRMTLHSNMVDSSLELAGALTSKGISKADLEAGRWNGASFVLSCIDRTADSSSDTLCVGDVGAVSIHGDHFTAELTILPTHLQEQPCPQTSPDCRAQLGDTLCRVSLRTRQVRAKIVSADGCRLTLDIEDTELFRWGRLKFLSGASAGLEQTIVACDERQVTLRERPHGPAGADDRVLLTEGCDGRLQTCRERFANVVDFRGEPYLPGTDILTRYPGD